MATSFLSWLSCLVGNLILSMTLMATSLPLFLCLPKIYGTWENDFNSLKMYKKCTVDLLCIKFRCRDIPPYTMPNWPDPSTSSENIWYTEAMSCTERIAAVTKWLGFVFTCGKNVVKLSMPSIEISIGTSSKSWQNPCSSGKYLTFTRCRSATETKPLGTKTRSCSFPICAARKLPPEVLVETH